MDNNHSQLYLIFIMIHIKKTLKILISNFIIFPVPKNKLSNWNRMVVSN